MGFMSRRQCLVAMTGRAHLIENTFGPGPWSLEDQQAMAECTQAMMANLLATYGRADLEWATRQFMR